MLKSHLLKSGKKSLATYFFLFPPSAVEEAKLSEGVDPSSSSNLAEEKESLLASRLTPFDTSSGEVRYDMSLFHPRDYSHFLVSFDVFNVQYC